MGKHLRFSLHGVAGNPKEVMSKLGITYSHATPQSMGEQWWFWNCENVTDPLPDFLSILRLDPHDQIGYGLSKEEADSIALCVLANGAPDYRYRGDGNYAVKHLFNDSTPPPQAEFCWVPKDEKTPRLYFWRQGESRPWAAGEED